MTSGARYSSAFVAALPDEFTSPTDRATQVLAQKQRMKNRYSLRLHVESRIQNAPAST